MVFSIKHFVIANKRKGRRKRKSELFFLFVHFLKKKLVGRGLYDFISYYNSPRDAKPSLNLLGYSILQVTCSYTSLEIVIHTSLYITCSYTSLDIVIHTSLYITCSYTSLDIVIHTSLYITCSYTSLYIVIHTSL